jgi:hypothetical protein
MTAALYAAQAERSAVMHENERLRNEAAAQAGAVRQTDELRAEVAALRAALTSATGGNAARAAVFLMNAGGSESAVAATATAIYINNSGPHHDSDDSNDDESDALTQSWRSPTKTSRKSTTTKFESASAQREIARGGLTTAEVGLYKLNPVDPKLESNRFQSFNPCA